METAIVGDLHLGLQYDGLERTEDVFKVLEQIQSEINKDKDITKVIWLGDIFDSPNISHNIITEFMHYLEGFRWDEYNPIKHEILKGNHDGETENKKGTPLSILATMERVSVTFHPFINQDYNEVYIPYTTQDKIEAIKDEFLTMVKPNTRVYTHCDIIDVTPGVEKEIARGLPCVLPDWILNSSAKIFSGHIHKPQVHKNLTVVGSVIKVSITEQVDNKVFYIDETPLPIACRDLQNYDINYSTEDGKEIYRNLLDNPAKIVKNKEAIVSVRMVCPHNLAHEVDTIKLQDGIRKCCYHLRFDFNVVREKQFRMKELDAKLSDMEIVRAYLEKQKVSDKDILVEHVKEVME